jgi:hypothetical protein
MVVNSTRDVARRSARVNNQIPSIPAAPHAVNLRSALRAHRQAAERLAILNALERTGWSRTRAAADLGIARETLWRKMRRLGIGPVRIVLPVELAARLRDINATKHRLFVDGDALGECDESGGGSVADRGPYWLQAICDLWDVAGDALGKGGQP